MWLQNKTKCLRKALHEATNANLAKYLAKLNSNYSTCCPWVNSTKVGNLNQVFELCMPYSNTIQILLLETNTLLATTLSQANCTYTVLIETTCSKGASDRVSLRFGDSKSKDILVPHLIAKRGRRVDRRGAAILTDAPHKPFQGCGIDQFQVIGSCVESPICYLLFEHGEW